MRIKNIFAEKKDASFFENILIVKLLQNVFLRKH